MTVCKQCGKPDPEYYESNKARCKECVKLNQAKYAKSPAGHATRRAWKSRPHYKRYQRLWHLRKRYGISEIEFTKMIVEAGGKCGICLKECARLVIDHCHRTGKVRGLLCPRCNQGLGHFEDDTAKMNGAIEYLKKSQGD